MNDDEYTCCGCSIVLLVLACLYFLHRIANALEGSV